MKNASLLNYPVDGRSLRPRRHWLLGGFALLALLLVACSGSEDGAGSLGPGNGEDTPEAEGDGLLVAASFAVLADVVANVGGERIEVWSVMPPGADPHTYEASPGDLARLSDVDYLVMVGGPFEGFAGGGAWQQAARDANLTTLVLADALGIVDDEDVHDRDHDEGDHDHDEGDHDHDHDHDHGEDPHFWLDPQHVLDVLPLIADGLAEIDPDGADEYHANADRYAAEIEAVDAELEAAVASIPEDRRVLVVHHDAYGYLAERFGFEVWAVLPGSGTGEASAAALAEIQRRVEETGAPAVFREPQYQSSVLEGLARDLGVEVGVLMTDAFTDEAGTYLELIRFNAESLVTHLGQ